MRGRRGGICFKGGGDGGASGTKRVSPAPASPVGTGGVRVCGLGGVGKGSGGGRGGKARRERGRSPPVHPPRLASARRGRRGVAGSPPGPPRPLDTGAGRASLPCRCRGGSLPGGRRGAPQWWPAAAGLSDMEAEFCWAARALMNGSRSTCAAARAPAESGSWRSPPVRPRARRRRPVPCAATTGSYTRDGARRGCASGRGPPHARTRTRAHARTHGDAPRRG